MLSLLFFLMIPLPPISTLFPYTTLFRSCSVPHRTCEIRTAKRSEAERIHDFHQTKNDVNVLPRPLKDLDRKSTRLNSSHTVISYAVFCLKKKKNTKVEVTAT